MVWIAGHTDPRPEILTPERKIAITPLLEALEYEASMTDILASFIYTPYPVLLESALTTPGLGRYSYLTSDPFLVLRSKSNRVEIDRRGDIVRLEDNPFSILKELLACYQTTSIPGLPPFQGGAIGYLAYELGHQLEVLPQRAIDDLRLPEMIIGFYDWVIARDHSLNETWMISTGLPEYDEHKARTRLDWVRTRLGSKDRPDRQMTAINAPCNLVSNFSREDYLDAVKTVKQYIYQGDIYQANISQRFEVSIEWDAWDLYRRLRDVNPAPFAAYLQYDDMCVLSSSPEQFLHLEHDVVHTRPMKGTRPRGNSKEEDQRLAEELHTSEKDRAENIMIVDLLRNDLGKVCVPGSIEVPELFTIEKYPRVFQMVSKISGRLRPGMDAVDLLTACFPGGSVTGAPKIRAMEIIDELEPVQRSVYCGAIGYIGFEGSMLTSIPIRTLLVKDRKAYFQVGGGIVSDSDPQGEYEETLHKARGSLDALGLADLFS